MATFREALLYLLTHRLNKDPAVLEHDDDHVLCRRAIRNLGLDRLHVTLESYLGRGRSGLVFAGSMASHPVAIKVTRLASEQDDDFLHEVEMHKHFGKALPQWTPRLHNFHIVQHHNRMLGVVVMDKMDGNVHEVVSQPGAEPAVLDGIACQVRDMVYGLERCGIVHGDLHTCNIGFLRENGFLKLKLIDFSRSFVCENDNKRLDPFMMWRASLLEANPAWNAALHRTGFQGSYLLQRWAGTNRLVWGRHDAKAVEAYTTGYVGDMHRRKLKYGIKATGVEVYCTSK